MARVGEKRALLSGSEEGGEGALAVAGEGQSSMTMGALNLVKAILGSGVFSLPTGIAAFSPSPRVALAPALVLITFFGALCSHTFVQIGIHCRATKSKSYGQAFRKSVGGLGWLPQVAATTACFAGCIAFTIIATDSFLDISGYFGIDSIQRGHVVLSLVCLVLFPLSLIRHVSGLAWVSAAGCAALTYTLFLISYRYLDGSYSPGGQFYHDEAAAIAAADDHNNYYQAQLRTEGGGGNWLQLMVLISMLSFAFSAHFLAPQIYLSLANPTDRRFRTMVHTGFGIATIFTALVACLGYLTFCGASQGNIMKNYSQQDALAVIGRLLVAGSVLSTFPLNFVGLREGLFLLVGMPQPSGTFGHWIVSAVLMSIIELIVMSVTDLGLVNSLTGALVQSTIVYVFPATMSLCSEGRKEKVDWALFIAGIWFAAAGVAVSLWTY